MKYENLAKNFANTLKKDSEFKILGTKNDDKWEWINRIQLNNMVNNCIETLDIGSIF